MVNLSQARSTMNTLVISYLRRENAALFTLLGLILFVLTVQQFTILHLKQELAHVREQQIDARVTQIEKEMVELGIRVGDIPAIK